MPRNPAKPRRERSFRREESRLRCLQSDRDHGRPAEVLSGHDAKVISAKEHETLRALYNSLKDGQTTWREVMDVKDGQKESGKSDDLNAAAAAAAAERGAKA